MSLNINQVKDIIERFNQITSSKDKDLVRLDEDKVGDGTNGPHICHLYYHKKHNIYIIATLRDDKLYVEPPFTTYHSDPYLAQRRLESLILNNVSITEFLESNDYKGLKNYILTTDVYNEYRRIKNLIYKFDGVLEDFYRTNEKLESDTKLPEEFKDSGFKERVLKNMEINNLI